LIDDELFGREKFPQHEILEVHPGGARGAAGLIFDRMESALGMRMTGLGPFDLITGGLFDRPDMMRACQDYGKAMGGLI